MPFEELLVLLELLVVPKRDKGELIRLLPRPRICVNIRPAGSAVVPRARPLRCYPGIN